MIEIVKNEKAIGITVPSAGVKGAPAPAKVMTPAPRAVESPESSTAHETRGIYVYTHTHKQTHTHMTTSDTQERSGVVRRALPPHRLVVVVRPFAHRYKRRSRARRRGGTHAHTR